MNRQSIPKILSHTAAISVLALAALQPAAHAETLRPPSVPLVACDPYFSIWSPADKLTDANTVHWTGKPHRLTSLVRINGKAFRLMGTDMADVPPLPQVNLEVLPTRTIYTFEGEGVRLTLTFMTAALPEDLMIYSRPVTYLTWEAKSTTSKKHAVEVYFDASAEIAVNEPSQAVKLSSEQTRGLDIVKVGTTAQPILAKRGDDLRIDWGYLYLASRRSSQANISCGSSEDRFGREDFAKRGFHREIDAPSTWQGPGSRTTAKMVLSAELDLGKVGAKPVSRWLILAYDDLYSIQYFKKNLRPYWRRNGAEAADLLNAAAHDYESLVKRCAAFDAQLMADLRKAGGEKYAHICALAYRQCVAANKLVADANGQPLLFPKENFSNGCIGTVDVIYPMAPQFLLFSPSLAKAMLVPILDYAASPRWRWPFAPHDLGTYPLANGQVYGGGERTERDQMPVEESGNMLLLIAALAQEEGNADFAAKYWPVLEKWADYLRDKGFDPENQLCTDDFAGHLAHNVNLSAKAICGLGAFAKLAALRGDNAKAQEYQKLAKEFAARWVKEADDGDHFRLAFDKPGTWSQKYNLVWDRILGLNLFPADALRKEMDYYKKVQNQYGLPLDNRKAYTKLDWTLWTATLTGSPEDMDALASRVLLFLNSTPDRVPMTDWYWTQNAKHTGFQARSVVGGVFLKLLYDQSLWRKWAGRDQTKAMNWAPLPEPPKITVVVPAADKEPATWRYTTEKPGDQWFAPDFDASSWKEGKSGFGTAGTPGAIIGTTWNTGDIWLRREIEVPAGQWQDLQFWMHHDEDAEVYLNGVLASKTSGYISNYDLTPIMANGKAALKPGKCVIAVHCHQTTGGQYIDVGLVDVEAK